MGCAKCNVETNLLGAKMYFFRWKNANIAIVGCVNHVTDIMNVLRDVQQRGTDATKKTDGSETPSSENSNTE